MVDPQPDAVVVDLSATRSIHVIGVGGAGMSAVGSVLAAMGHRVSGSDMKALQGLDRLRAEGITVTVGHSEAALPAELDLVTRSTAVPDRNTEVVAARRRGIPVVSRAAVLEAITRVRPTVAVAGTHGKTTTSSMLALILIEAGLEPSFIIGGELNEIGSGARWATSSGWFVVEADESDGTFLTLERQVGIVTSVEPDHLNHYGSHDALVAAFGEFAAGVTETLILCADDAGAQALAAGALATTAKVRTYGTSPDAAVRAVDIDAARASSRFRVIADGTDLGLFGVATPGAHNVRNATAAITAALALGVEPDAARRALGRFAGVARRYQFRGEVEGIRFVDDYAHLPTEVDAALEAAGAGGFDRIVCVFQPHRYSRTGALWSSFGECFRRADVLVVTDVYASGEDAVPGVTGKLIVDAVEAAGPPAEQRIVYLPHRDDLIVYLLAELRAGDLCLTLGAGDLTTLADSLLDAKGHR